MISAASLLPSRVLPIQRTKFLKISSVGAQTRMASSANNVMYSSPKELWQGILERYDAAQAAKASTLTDTNTEVITDGGIGFILKIATTLRDKPKAPAAGGNAPKAEWRNPFLPPDPDLFVCHLSTTHSLVLNKFNIVPHHALVITREFHLQEEPLNAADFEATWTVMQAMPQGALAYFNCGPVSGASQPHKHLQVIPLPLIPSAPTATPFWPNTATALASAPSWKEGIMQLSSLPFLSFIARVDEASATGALLADTHTALLQKAQDAVAAASEPLSHNLVMTKEFMMVVPRRADGTGPVSCNAMAFAGSFFVRGVDELEFIRKTGPMQILTDVGFPSHQ